MSADTKRLLQWLFYGCITVGAVGILLGLIGAMNSCIDQDVAKRQREAAEQSGRTLGNHVGDFGFGYVHEYIDPTSKHRILVFSSGRGVAAIDMGIP